MEWDFEPLWRLRRHLLMNREERGNRQTPYL